MPADPKLAGRVVSGVPGSVAGLSDWINTAQPDELRAALHRIAELSTGNIPQRDSVLVLAEAGRDGHVTGAYEWHDDDEFGGWYDVTGAENLPQALDGIRWPDGCRERAPDEKPDLGRFVDGWWVHNSAIVVAMCGGAS
jgi:hypothetical protein